ncbi:MAG TPA: hypothetical protein VFE98_06205 [Candidatus Bathyarchaeia archaeon]|nr:hypothetical protein [Candidatus Bathyarchaeia archaeon]
MQSQIFRLDDHHTVPFLEHLWQRPFLRVRFSRDKDKTGPDHTRATTGYILRSWCLIDLVPKLNLVQDQPIFPVYPQVLVTLA